MRRRRTLVLGLLLIVSNAGLAASAPQGHQPASVDEALAAAKAAGRMVLVHFFSPG